MNETASTGVRAKSLLNAFNLSTPFGLLIAHLGRAEVRFGGAGLWLAERYRLSFPVASAFTVGNVILTPGTFAALGEDVLAHEKAHTWQYMRWGWMFGPAYLLAMAWSWLLTGDRAARNHFERAAGLAQGGYTDAPGRSILRRLHLGRS
ncbi:MAG: hypothetical protein ACK5IM_05860 [Demequina sp.]|uniref:hypothetical protein n=1 Tax=Demequina sp. TaxID=2050685 RepID=UPI003A8790E1